VEAERALQSRVDQLQLALNASGAVLWKADLVRDAIQAGPDFFRLLRYAPDGDLPGFSDFLQASEVSAELMPQLDALRRGELQNVLGEICFAGSDGIRRWFNAGARITGAAEDGTPVEITGILYETTPIKEKELVRKEKELEDLQSQKMETIGRLAGGVAHDFNNLLHVIMGYTEILRKVSEDDPVTGELAKPILEASTRGRELVRQLLLFSRNKTPELAPVDLCSVTSSFLGLLRRIIEENIVIASRIPERLPRVMGDAGQIEQVLMNLCINSRDAMPDGGTISISLAERSFTRPEKMLSGNLRPGRYVVLEVSDTGPGIPPEKLRTVFEPFYTTKQVDKGTGLGLATVQGIIESHGGMISAANSPGGGFSIELYFPVAPAGAEVGHSTSRGSAGEKLDLDSISVLVAEDDPQVRNLTIEGLSAAGIRVYRASSGREAVEVFLSAPDSIDILIFDVVMPGLSGPDAFREIVNAGYRKPVIFTTGYAGDRLSCLPGDFVMISKPYAISELVQLIGEIIHQEGDGP
jgi:signal transduction histidine kinase